MSAARRGEPQCYARPPTPSTRTPHPALTLPGPQPHPRPGTGCSGRSQACPDSDPGRPCERSGWEVWAIPGCGALSPLVERASAIRSSLARRPPAIGPPAFVVGRHVSGLGRRAESPGPRRARGSARDPRARGHTRRLEACFTGLHSLPLNLTGPHPPASEGGQSAARRRVQGDGATRRHHRSTPCGLASPLPQHRTCDPSP